MVERERITAWFMRIIEKVHELSLIYVELAHSNISPTRSNSDAEVIFTIVKSPGLSV